MLTVSAACDGCQLCEKHCPFNAMVVVNKIAVAGDNCTLCGACLNVCTRGALSIERRRASPEELARYKGVFIVAECRERDGVIEPRKHVLELLGKARGLADSLGEPLTVLMLGSDDKPMNTDVLFEHGADAVIRYRNRLLDRYATDSYTTVLSAIVASRKPSIVLIGATPDGRDLAPRLAARLRVGLTADCTGLDIDDHGQLVQTRPAFGGNIMASILSPYTRPQMATVRPNVFPVGVPRVGRRGPVEDAEVAISQGLVRTKVLSVETLKSAGDEGIENAKIIVSAGQGVQTRENMKLVAALAEALGGKVAGSRPLVELGWIPHTLQVGQSGTTVSPDLYVAVGISGAVQHIVGMSSARRIIAINADPEAPIFKVADLGIVGDALQVLPRLIQEVKAAKLVA
jgi:electron transfer flavoprotein alpha subunit/NAD-dependent dihydropyrimidine dehydrogenase PreA subunit